MTNEITPQVKKKRIRRKKGEVSQDKLYFNNLTQEAINEFQIETNKEHKDKIYLERIFPAFDKLAENLINIHKFVGLYDSYEDLKSDCVNFLFEKLHKFDGSRGTNAFSYFNVVAKNWLIIKAKHRLKVNKKHVSIDDTASLTFSETKSIEDSTIIYPNEYSDSEQEPANIINVLYEIRQKTKSDNELSCINSIITLFENLDDVELLNKSAILLYMRELSGLNSKQLTTTMQVLKKYYKKTRAKELND
jgi:hypothetical protein